MSTKKALTEKLFRLSVLALASVGAFSSCTMRTVMNEPVSPPEQIGVATDLPDSVIPFSISIDFPKEKKFSRSDSSDEWSAIYEACYGAGSASEVIMSTDEIENLNRNIAEDCPSCTDMRADLRTFASAEEIKEKIKSYPIPVGQYFDKTGRSISQEDINRIKENIDLDSLTGEKTVKNAVIVERCSLKSLPTELDFYSYGDKYYSAIQETELIPSFPVRILHESKDRKFLFVVSYYYHGWIPASAAALCNDEQYRFYTSPDKYVTVIEPYTHISGIRYDMGAFLPYISENDTHFKVHLPVREKDGTLSFTTGEVSRDAAVYGRLPYTAELFFSQAFKYLGTDYGWGGADGGVDCSGFVCSVFRSFGIYLPRNTVEQRQYSGKQTLLSGKTNDEIFSILTSLKAPSTLHRPGHVMIFLGIKDSIPYVIHAPQGGEKVSVMALTYTANLELISEIALQH